jgi:hypothetical protein
MDHLRPITIRSASAADIPPGFRCLAPDEITATQDLLWDMALAAWIVISQSFTGLPARHFCKVIRCAPALSCGPQFMRQDRDEPKPNPPTDAAASPAAPRKPIVTPEQAREMGYKSITSPFNAFQRHLLKEMTSGLKARKAPYLVVTLPNGYKEIWTPKKKNPLKHQL